MLFAGERYLKLHRIIFIALGLWPYQKSFIWRIQAVFFFSAYCSTFFSQSLTFVTMACNMDCTLKRLSFFFVYFIQILSYYSFYFNSEIIKKALKHMQFDWKLFENSEAMNIFEEYLFEAYIYIFSAIIFVGLASIVFLTFECRAVILDIIAPMNECRPRKTEIDLELFVNEEQYFHLYVIQETLGSFIANLSIIAIGMFFAIVAKHLCATYKIASCLIRNAVTIRTLQLPVAQRMLFMHRSICLSVHIHRRSMQFTNNLIISFNVWYFPLLLFCVLSLSCIMFRLYNAIILFNDFFEIFLSCLMFFSCIAYMFVANFLGQSYIEHSAEVLESIYDTLWYVAPLPVQKLFLIMQKSVKSHKLIMGSLFVLSIEGFSTLITSAVSYFTVMHAMRSRV
ncbi:hypothetical protein DMN91_009875 [Ooceraea biroi]|uniref:Odorant receptor n=1 Tax=Ooceraea biroi TaxID=2015173 RepID=A0A026VZD9_OOCBI|nr:uncharacterized protein LOC105285752 isoform X1 [Ooceraea biroi]EZA48239.1 hypothetical protein X777_14137 [Ooceraea biroi]RLU17639.1 hypothetical protein DMN91_009875 [Ooceraea biroi]